jgi:mRNA-degrading endonuclease RelE of RelBE toxin-antitoxin system
MSYRIQVHPDARSFLRTLAPHVVPQLGHALAELAEAAALGTPPDADEVRVDGCVMRLAVDHGNRLLRVLGIEEGELHAPALQA